METFHLVCVVEDAWHTQDSTRGTCVECGGGLWISVSGWQAAVAQSEGAEIQTICMDCFQPNETTEIVPPTKEQIDAIARQIESKAVWN